MRGKEVRKALVLPREEAKSGGPSLSEPSLWSLPSRSLAWGGKPGEPSLGAKPWQKGAYLREEASYGCSQMAQSEDFLSYLRAY